MAEKNEVRNIKRPKKSSGDGRKFRRVRETWSELKKVTWPTPGTVVKSTGVVLLVVAIFLLVLLAFDLILRFFVFNPLVSGEIGTMADGAAKLVRAGFSVVLGGKL